LTKKINKMQYELHGKRKMCSVCIEILYLFVAVTIFCTSGQAAEVNFFYTEKIKDSAQKQVRLGCEFYGIELHEILLREGESFSGTIAEILQKFKIEPIALIISADALHLMDLNLLDTQGSSIPLLVTGLFQDTVTAETIRAFSENEILGCASYEIHESNFSVKVIQDKALAQELAGQNIPFYGDLVHYLKMEKTADSKTILAFDKQDDGSHYPFLIKKGKNATDETYFAAFVPEPGIASDKASTFIWLSPVLLFLNHVLGDYCWHRSEDSANLTIDDPWLIEPYGHLSFKKILEQMQKHNFHTTIAFVPWNYDRSRKDVISIFKENTERFSVCLHGNNHDHYEFYKFMADSGDPWPGKPFEEQELDIQQAIVRMNLFKDLTGVSYDRAMVFPHGIAPKKTLRLLKKYNFLATLNSQNIPLGSKRPESPLHVLRAVSLEFEKFPSIKRLPAMGLKNYEIVIDLFLDNPLMFYGHHDLFSESISGFNDKADFINRINPKLKWRNIGDVVRGLYYERSRKDGGYDILPFAYDLQIKNQTGRKATYLIQTADLSLTSSTTIRIEDKNYHIEDLVQDGVIKLNIPNNDSIHIVFQQPDQLDLTSINISKKDFRIWILRMLSDFRDRNLSTLPIFNKFVNYYYNTGAYKYGLVGLGIFVFVCLFFVYVSLRIFKRKFIHRLKLQQTIDL
jgi:hypothetical protein